MLEVADAAQQAGCAAAARQIYKDARRTFVGLDHAELHLRAQFAIAYLTRTSEKLDAPAGPRRQRASAEGERGGTVGRSGAQGRLPAWEPRLRPMGMDGGRWTVAPPRASAPSWFPWFSPRSNRPLG
jgi:hypothetical protein